jgi:hypothetical protein
MYLILWMNLLLRIQTIDPKDIMNFEKANTQYTTGFKYLGKGTRVIFVTHFGGQIIS